MKRLVCRTLQGQGPEKRRGLGEGRLGAIEHYIYACETRDSKRWDEPECATVEDRLARLEETWSPHLIVVDAATTTVDVEAEELGISTRWRHDEQPPRLSQKGLPMRTRSLWTDRGPSSGADWPLDAATPAASTFGWGRVGVVWREIRVRVCFAQPLDAAAMECNSSARPSYRCMSGTQPDGIETSAAGAEVRSRGTRQVWRVEHAARARRQRCWRLRRGQAHHLV